ncbi:carboxypeptidase-like regulatory domain-containing protein [uncultured Winogradskyella sp.]|uniref:carboxypeptidase-like regulatory domain-containing protein n=1 Tax=uncultured Winogradskyella sp. TaxID=395353 RepID=UPI0030ED2BD6|tara:strand:+ start:507 stop:2318 length:1812 start_codon:yes stop_codon:yes gene_type:complete
MASIKKILSLILIFLFALTSLTSCETDDGNNSNGQQETIPDSFSEYFGNDISRDFIGNVIDSNKNPIEGVTITIGNETALTDSNGIFIINSANVNERFGYVKAEKSGYIHGSRSVVPSGGTNKVTIMLLEATVVGTVNSGSSETISVANGSSVSFDGNFIKEDGSAYSGSVDVIMHHLDPADDDMAMQMPGMLYAQNNEGAERMLQTLGMLAIELRGTGGEDLNLGEGSISEIKMPVDASLMSIAPATIPLWYFDEVNGYWKEEGQATLQGNMYVGNVSHFSFWNCDIPAEAITLCITATNESNNSLSNLWVSITSTTFGTTYGYTNENGEVCGYVPSNETLELNIYSYDFCGDTPLYNEMIGPFSTDSNISIIVQESSDIIEETIIGNFNSCNGDAVNDGYVQLTYGYQTYIDLVTNGEFEINLLRCEEDNTFKLKGSDYVNLQTTDSISYTFTTPLTNIGSISACNTVTEFIQYSIDDGETVLIIDGFQTGFSEASDAVDGPSLTISGSSNTGNCFYMFGNLDDTVYEGSYDYFDWNDANDTGFNIQECIDMTSTNNNIIFNLTTLGAAGEYIDINFSGAYEDYNGNPHTITGVVHVLRDY